jgi:oxygen-independent coproporphyrinogen III oxidase
MNMEKESHFATTSLIGRSLKVINDSNLDKIWQAGFKRDPLHYHSTVMYPSLKAMDNITEQQIYTDFQNTYKDFTLYVHIPFCSGKCTFCYFYQIEKPTDATIAEYLDALKKEIEITGKKIADQLDTITIKSIFFGGGSPTVLSNEQFEDLIGTIKRQFVISEKIEITVEIHPEIMRGDSRALFETYFACKVNRLNMGVQSFDDAILATTNRRHTAQEGIDAFKLAREIGFRNINVDLLYPLPDLTPAIWEKTLDTAFGLEPESITTYFTAIRKHSSMYHLLRKHPERFPDEYMNHLFRVMTIEKAKEKGYDHRKLTDWFVKPQEDFHYNHQKNEVKRTEDIQLLSFGSGVFTYLNYFQFYNFPNIHKYCEMLKDGKLPIWRGVRLTKEERLARAMVLGIKSGEVDIDEIEKRFEIDVLQKYHPLLKNLEALGLLEMRDGTIRLSEKGVLFADEVAVQFITKNMHARLSGKSKISESEKDLVDCYNFMYDIKGLSFLQ